MKRYLTSILALFMICMMFYSCEREHMLYDPNLSAARFDIKDMKDSLTYSFALHPGISRDTIRIPIRIMGFTSPNPRKVNVVADSATSARENIEYLILPCTVPADSTSTLLQVVLLKSEELDAKRLRLGLQITESSDFVPGPIEERKFKVYVTNKLTKPEGWIGYFGDYSEAKHRFIIEVTGKGTNYNAWSQMEIIHWMGELNKALYDYNKRNPDKPLRDENGTLISFPII